MFAFELSAFELATCELPSFELVAFERYAFELYIFGRCACELSAFEFDAFELSAFARSAFSFTLPYKSPACHVLRYPCCWIPFVFPLRCLINLIFTFRNRHSISFLNSFFFCF